MNILLGISGSVAAIYTSKLVTALSTLGTVKVVTTNAGSNFTNEKYSGVSYYTDKDEVDSWQGLGDSILHIDLRNWADVFVIAPLSANTMAKIAGGLCDNLLTCVVRAWDYGKPMIVCPAMNTKMWENPPTGDHLDWMVENGILVILPVEKKLACGDVGIGAMCPHEAIVTLVSETKWMWPLDYKTFIPEAGHPGSYGAVRKHDIHTGVDLYCQDGESVVAVEDGEIVKTGQFTGSIAGSPWWENTNFIAVQGASGTVVYGEITLNWHSRKVKRGDPLGFVKRVLKPGKERPDIPHHSSSMLHIELYKEFSYPATWGLDESKPIGLLDPTARLKLARGEYGDERGWQQYQPR